MIPAKDTRNFLVGCFAVGALASVGSGPALLRGAFLAVVLAWGLKRIYRIEDDQVVGLQPWKDIVLEGMIAGAIAGIPLSIVSLMVYGSAEDGAFKNDPASLGMIVAPPGMTMVSCLLYGAGLYAIHARSVQQTLAAKKRVGPNLWLVLALAALVGLVRCWFFEDDRFPVRKIFGAGIALAGALPFSLLWLEVSSWLDPYARRLWLALAQADPGLPPQTPRRILDPVGAVAGAGIFAIIGTILIVIMAFRYEEIGSMEGRNSKLLQGYGYAIAQFAREHKRPPATISDVKCPRMVYMTKVELGQDYWRRPLVYQVDEASNALTLKSYGRDGRPGGTGLDADVVMKCRLSPLEELLEDLEGGWTKVPAVKTGDSTP